MEYTENYFKNLYNSYLMDFISKSQDEEFVEKFTDNISSSDLYIKENIYLRLFNNLSQINLYNVANCLFRQKDRERITTVGKMYDDIVDNLKICFDSLAKKNSEIKEKETYYIEVGGYLRGQIRAYKDYDSSISVVVDILFLIDYGTNDW